MNLNEFFNSKEKVEIFLNAKNENEARAILESDCGKITDEEFNEVKKGFKASVSEHCLKNVSGGAFTSKSLTSSTAKNVYLWAGAALGAVALAGGTGYAGYKYGKDQGEEDTLNAIKGLKEKDATTTIRSTTITRGNDENWYKVESSKEKK